MSNSIKKTPKPRVYTCNHRFELVTPRSKQNTPSPYDGLLFLSEEYSDVYNKAPDKQQVVQFLYECARWNTRLIKHYEQWIALENPIELESFDD